MKYQIIYAEEVESSTGKKYKKVELTDGTKVSCWPDFSKYAEVVEGAEIEGEIQIKGKYKNLIDGFRPPVSFTRKPNLAEAQQRKAEYVKEAQERKDDSISWFHSNNAAIQLLSALNPNEKFEDESLKEFLRKWRKWFLDEWKNRPPF